ncbi:MAG: hypothetical protein KGI78_01615 [Patescibacteria group bacterium]|nr:hypothetical protein [Patescibacteria group bacterium]MDE1943941.1 hypothetical protein [Patescibacteria group bacterium]MDE1945026.1 hypothetical protein [Patescibacteria group bacterium]MDE2057532.1 hypothetical protein [Patescibacteria group bacterium]
MIRTLFWLCVLFLALSFFGISIRSIVESPAGQANLAYLTYLAISAWHLLQAYAVWVSRQIETVRA